MNKKHKNFVIYPIAAVVFLIQLHRGFHIPEHTPGSIASGAMNAPLAVVVSAVFSGIIAWIFLEAIFWLGAKVRNSTKR